MIDIKYLETTTMINQHIEHNKSKRLIEKRNPIHDLISKTATKTGSLLGMWLQCSVLRSSIFNQESSVTPLLTQLHIPPLASENNIVA